MIFRGDIVKMEDNPTHGKVGTDGLFRVVIYYHDGHGSEADWQLFEITAEDVTFDEGQQINKRRLDELRAQHGDET